MKQSIKILMVAGLTMFFAWTASAQKGNPDKLRSEKIAFISTELNLTPEEAEKFWPVYNVVDAEKKEAIDAVKEARKALRKAIKDNAEDAEISKLLKEFISLEAKSREISAKSLDKVQKVLPAAKVAKLYLAEEKFRRQQINRLGEGRPEGHNHGGGHGHNDRGNNERGLK